MAKFAPPVLKRPEDVSQVEVWTSQEELEFREASEDRRHQENLGARAKESKEALIERRKEAAAAKEREAKEEKARIEERERLKNDKNTPLNILTKIRREEAEEARIKALEDRQARLDEIRLLSEKFDHSYRTGVLGRLAGMIQNQDGVVRNLKVTLADSFYDRILGKSLEDKQKEAEGQVQNSLLQRLLGAEKYSAPPEAPDIFIPSPRDDPQEDDFIRPAKPSGEDPSNEVKILEDKSADKNQVPLLKKISNSISGLFQSFENFVLSERRNRAEDQRKETVEGITEKFSGTPDGPEVVPQDKLDLGFGKSISNKVSSVWEKIKARILGALTGVGQFVVRALPVVALATGLYLKIKEAVGGWFSAEAWGVSKITGFVSGLIGGLDSGVRGMFKNAGAWALIGAGIGSAVPVVGTLVGGLVGALFGGIFGYFGGEKIAWAIQSVGDWAWGHFNSLVETIKSFFTEFPKNIEKFIQEAYEDVISWGQEKIRSIRDSISNFMESVEAYFKKFFTLDYWFKDDQARTVPVEPTVESSRDRPPEDSSRVKVLEAEEGPDRTPLKIEIEPNNDIENLMRSMDSFIESLESQPRAQAKENLAQEIYEQSIENSVVNNSRNEDHSRTVYQNIATNSNNKAMVNISKQPSSRNQESSVFGTQSFINGGFGNPSRF